MPAQNKKSPMNEKQLAVEEEQNARLGATIGVLAGLCLTVTLFGVFYRFSFSFPSWLLFLVFLVCVVGGVRGGRAFGKRLPPFWEKRLGDDLDEETTSRLVYSMVIAGGASEIFNFSVLIALLLAAILFYLFGLAVSKRLFSLIPSRFTRKKG